MTTDLAMVIITTIYVIATLAISWSNWETTRAAQEQVRISKEQISRMIEQYNAVNRPIVSARFEAIRSGLLCFVFRNIGPLPANNLQIAINQTFINNLPDNRLVKALDDLAQATLFLAPSQEITILIGGSAEFSTISKEKAEIVLSYDDYTERIQIDLKDYKDFLIYQSPLEDIAKTIKSEHKENKSFRQHLISVMESLSHTEN